MLIIIDCDLLCLCQSWKKINKTYLKKQKNMKSLNVKTEHIHFYRFEIFTIKAAEKQRK